MIVNKSIKGLHIIFHQAHGLLAGKIANEIKEEFRPPHWFETLIAVCEHDDRQLNFKEKDYLSEIGVPLDFTEDKSTVKEVLERMEKIISSANNKSRWIRLLISYHLEFIYSDYKNSSKQIAQFFENEEIERKIILKVYKFSDVKARAYYEFLRFCDRLSLILCNDEAPDCERLLEINTSIKEETYFIKKSEDDTLVISPWIFTSAKFELSVEERILKQTQFSSAKEFESILMATPPSLKKWKLGKL
ncbi:hypothetical protein Aeqsu_3111 [Aequorivita sublithincola DSM 14238]|uniref:DUF3891 family protein n=1 Tax=Aequorivita sublithincola (strain DSM 14238 / LMG 21431 / ACAM 643 / 9-3) TaxID=746697 RepID=I3YZX8_AEQSU|nr:DUF3891 family protein [Aequorivita sublithincola]AFL82546.1 hypothetical protein Aeqsu_3111 [Aequorivita sublithincola DSM 14238]